MEVDADIRPDNDTPISPTAFDNLKRKKSKENPILPDKKRYKVNLPPRTPVSERPDWPVHCCAVVHLEQEMKMFRNLNTDIWLYIYHFVFISLCKKNKLFHFIIIVFKSQSDHMWDKKLLVMISLISLLGAGFCFYQHHTEEQVWQNSKIQNRTLWKRLEGFLFEQRLLLYGWGKSFSIVIVHGSMEENLLNTTCSGTRLDFSKRWEHTKLFMKKFEQFWKPLDGFLDLSSENWTRKKFSSSEKENQNF